ncbi:MAG: hypothetical protein ACRD1Z_19795 [Vicinamibacteria bacterium]
MVSIRSILFLVSIIALGACVNQNVPAPVGGKLPLGGSSESITMNFDSTPRGGEIQINGSPIGQTPLSYSIPHVYMIASHRPKNSFDLTFTPPGGSSETYRIDLGKAWDEYYRRRHPVQEIGPGVLLDFMSYRVHFDAVAIAAAKGETYAPPGREAEAIDLSPSQPSSSAPPSPALRSKLLDPKEGIQTPADSKQVGDVKATPPPSPLAPLSPASP